MINILVSFQGNLALEKSRRQKPYSWIPEQGWEDMLQLSQVLPDKFGSLVEDVEKKVKNHWCRASVTVTCS